MNLILNRLIESIYTLCLIGMGICILFVPPTLIFSPTANISTFITILSGIFFLVFGWVQRFIFSGKTAFRPHL